MKKILLSGLGLILCVSVMSFTGCSKEKVDNSSTQSSATVNEATVIGTTYSGTTDFEPPVQLMVEGKPLNAAGRFQFASPALFDVDGDDQAELVSGSLMGDVSFYKNSNLSGKGDPVWGARQALKDTDGKSIRTSNW